MKPPHGNDQPSLSQLAYLLLDYTIRYQKQNRPQSSRPFLERILGGAYPLFRFAFPSKTVLDAAADELDLAGYLEAESVVSDPTLIERIRRAAQNSIRTDCLDIVKRIPLSKIWEVVESGGIDENVGLLVERLKFLGHSDLCAAASLSKQYSKALLEIGRNVTTEKQRLMALLAEIVRMEPLKSAPQYRCDDLAMCWYRADSFIPDREFRLLVALLNSEQDPEALSRTVVELAETHRADNVAFVLIGRANGLAKTMVSVMEKTHKVLLVEDDLKDILLSRDPRQTMRARVFPQLPPSILSPFRFKGPVTGTSFFGRASELHRILNARKVNYSILGARQVGKTSLLKTVRDRINQDLKSEGIIAVFVDATSNRRLPWFQKNLMQEVLRQSKELDVDIDWVEPGDTFFEELATALKKSQMKYLLLVDEVDYLAQDPQIDLLEEFVRSMSNEEYCRFVLSGYRSLRERMEDRSSFFYNLFQPIVLGPLERVEAADMVRTQMERIYVGFENDRVVERVLDLGSTFASYLQYMCDLLLQRLDEPGRARTVTTDDAIAVYGSPEFTKEITSPITDNTDPELGPLERIIVYWGANHADDQFTEKDLLEGLSRVIYSPDLSDVRRALNFLTTTYMLSEAHGKYRLWMPHLRKKLREAEPDLEFVIKCLAEEYRKRDRQRTDLRGL